MIKIGQPPSMMGAIQTFKKVGTCSEALCNVLDRAFGHPNEPEEKGTLPLAGGISQYGYQCGLLWGAAFASGSQAFHRYGTGPQAETMSIIATGRAINAFRSQNKGLINCSDLTDLGKTSSNLEMMVFFLLKGGTIRCFLRAGKYAPVAYREIQAALDEVPGSIPSGPVSCSALLAENLGLNEQQRVMASGLAGGIGLCGGACGALGAAIWTLNMRRDIDQPLKDAFKDPNIQALIDRFLEVSGHEFECSRITGESFATVQEHATHLRAGGCRDLLESLRLAVEQVE